MNKETLNLFRGT